MDQVSPSAALRQKQIRLPSDRVAQLITDYQAGTDMNALAKLYGIHRHSVRALLARAGVEVRSKGLRDLEIDEAVRLYIAGYPLAKLAIQFGCDRETVRRALKLRNVVLRRPW